MKIPKQIRIGGVEFNVVTESRLNDGCRILAGQINLVDCQILINPEGAHEHKCITMWHEIMHGVEMQAQLELGENRERIIEAFARGVYQVLQDNGRRLFDISIIDEEEQTK